MYSQDAFDGTVAINLRIVVVAGIFWLLSGIGVHTTPPLQIIVAPHTGIAPLEIRVDVRQDPDTVSGREVCIHVSGPAANESCWTSDQPTPLITRHFILDEQGTYEVWVGAGSMRSGYEIVAVTEHNHGE